MINTIVANSEAKYLSEVITELPLGILSKTLTNVGGTHIALNYPDNYIIVVPTRDLVDNKLSNPSNSIYNLFGLYAGISNKSFRDYIRNNELHHILVTYDSLPKLISWLEVLNINAYNYRALFDEYHLLITEMGYRAKAIENLVKVATKFKHYTFMSATPIREKFLPKVLADLPYTEIKWTNTKTIKPTRFNTHCVYKTTVRLLTELKNGLKIDDKEVEEIFVFTNTVIGIKQIVDSANLSPDEVKIVCADTIRNKQVLGDFEISKMTGSNKKFNFFTAKGFQGCDLFSKSGLVIVVSDSKRKHTLTDIQTTLYQISGRIRDLDNVFADRLFHVYSTGYVTQTEEDYLKEKQELIETAKELIEDQNSKTEQLRLKYRSRLNIDSDFIVFNDETNLYEYSDFKEKFSDYNYELTQHIYNNGLNVRQAYLEADIDPGKQQYTWNEDKDVELVKRVTTVSFKTLLEQYIELRESNEDLDLIKQYELEHPIFKEAYDKLGVKGINSCKFVEDNIKEKLYATDVSKSKELKNILLDKFSTDTFYTLKEVKAELQNIYNSLGIKSKAKTTDLEVHFNIEYTSKRLDNKKVAGIIFNL